MAAEFTLTTASTVIPIDKGGPRVGVGCRATVTRSSAGAVGVQILRGSGGAGETFTVSLRTRMFSLEANVPRELSLATIDLLAAGDFTARSYRMRLLGDNSEDIEVELPLITTEPYSGG